jgi:hypothetical protein
MDPSLHRAIVMRSQGRCEAEVEVSGVWLRCSNPATDVHHMLTKARGGRNLDRIGETYHLIHLCRDCHRLCDGADAYAGGMLIEGNVTWDKLNSRPIYKGTDPYLTKRYTPTSGSWSRTTR